MNDERGYVSWTEYFRDLSLLGVEDEDIPEPKDEQIEKKLVDIREEMRDRELSCGGDAGYPFQLEEEGLQRKDGAVGLVYRFLLLLTHFGPDPASGAAGGARLFEELSLEALRSYLGGSEPLSSGWRFGAPRTQGPRGFQEAVDELCIRLGEGEGFLPSPEARRKKDAHLDLVAWKAFPDGRSGKLVLFGQCGAGNDWFGKLHELQPQAWCHLWLRRSPDLIPLKAMFVPRRIEPIQWREAVAYGGVLFDRCRISWLLPTPPPERCREIEAWMSNAFQEALR